MQRSAHSAGGAPPAAAAASFAGRLSASRISLGLTGFVLRQIVANRRPDKDSVESQFKGPAMLSANDATFGDHIMTKAKCDPEPHMNASIPVARHSSLSSSDAWAAHGGKRRDETLSIRRGFGVFPQSAAQSAPSRTGKGDDAGPLQPLLLLVFSDEARRLETIHDGHLYVFGRKEQSSDSREVASVSGEFI